jgi:hypothetical protein
MRRGARRQFGSVMYDILRHIFAIYGKFYRRRDAQRRFARILCDVGATFGLIWNYYWCRDARRRFEVMSYGIPWLIFAFCHI